MLGESGVGWERGGSGGDGRGTLGLGVTDMFIILTAVIVACVCTYLKTYQTVHFSVCSLLYVNYISVKIFKLKNYK